jgi:hypothetical protein
MVTKRGTHLFVIITFITLYIVTSLISTIHVVAFFELSNPTWLAISLAIAYEIGAGASLAALTILKRLNKGIVWALFIALATMQAMGNMYFTFVNMENYAEWSQLFGIDTQSLIFQKRILSVISGGMLPLIALGFIKSLIDYIRPNEQLVSQNTMVNTVNEEDETMNLGANVKAEVKEKLNVEPVETKKIVREPVKVEKKEEVLTKAQQKQPKIIKPN